MLALVSCHFNPCRYQAPRDNFTTFVEGLDGLPLTVVELAFGEPVIPGAHVIKGDHRHLMWQKERLLNIAIERLPACVDRVAWVDGDLLFDNAHQWFEQVEKALDESPVVQCFSSVTDLGPDGEPLNDQHSRSLIATPDRMGRPGFCWAARREALDGIGLYDKAIVGCGDVFVAYAALGWFDTRFVRRFTTTHRKHGLLYMANLYSRTRGKVGVVDHHMSHLYHGSFTDRQYRNRDDILTTHDYDPSTDVTVNDAGVLEWAGNKPEFEADVTNYFLGRQEDQ